MTCKIFGQKRYLIDIIQITAVLSEAWAKLRDWASVAGRGRLILSGSVAQASLETAVVNRLVVKIKSGENPGAIDHST